MLRLLRKLSFLKTIWINANEKYLNISTVTISTKYKAGIPNEKSLWEGKESDKIENKDYNQYETEDYWYLYKVIRMLKCHHNDIFFDLGSGMGRVLCVMARRSLKRCIGIEFDNELCKIARQNAEKLRGRKSPIDIICEDVTKTDLSYGTIYYLFNPFGEETMRKVLTKINVSLNNSPRTIQIIYYNAVHENVLEACSWLHFFNVFYTAGGLRVSFWSNMETRDCLCC